MPLRDALILKSQKRDLLLLTELFGRVETLDQVELSLEVTLSFMDTFLNSAQVAGYFFSPIVENCNSFGFIFSTKTPMVGMQVFLALCPYWILLGLYEGTISHKIYQI